MFVSIFVLAAYVTFVLPGTQGRAPADTSRIVVPENTLTPKEESSGNASSGEESRLSRGWDFSVFPIFFYSPDLGFGGGGGGVITYRDAPLSLRRPQSISLVAFYTSENKALVVIAPELNIMKGYLELNASIRYSNFPGLFYGLGMDTEDSDEESFTVEGLGIQPTISLKVCNELRFGWAYDVEKLSMIDYDENGIIDMERVTGSRGGIRSGMGPAAIWDSRDNLFYPTNGGYYKGQILFYRSWAGSDFVYKSYELDIRRYISTFGTHVSAAQLVFIDRIGDVPFTEMTSPGTFARGIDAERFRDRALGFLQLEHRFPIWKRYGAVVFGSLSILDDAVENLRIREATPTTGFGFRYSINPEERLNFRFDIGFSRYGAQPYFQVRESF
jgi:hypothetical protein